MNDFERRLIDTAQTSVYLAEFARQGKTIIGMDYFAYNSSSAIRSVATTASAQDIIPIQSNSDFVMMYMSGIANINGTISGLPNATVQFTDQGTGKTYYNQPTLFSNVLGSGGYPFLLPSPRIIAPNTNVKIDVVNNEAVTVDFWISLMGARVYYAS